MIFKQQSFFCGFNGVTSRCYAVSSRGILTIVVEVHDVQRQRRIVQIQD